MYEFLNFDHFCLFITIKANVDGITPREMYEQYIKSIQLGDYETYPNMIIGLRREDIHCIGFIDEGYRNLMLATNKDYNGVYALAYRGFHLPIVMRHYKNAVVETPLEMAKIPEMKIDFKPYEYPGLMMTRLKKSYDRPVALIEGNLPMAVISSPPERKEVNGSGT